jgi:ribosome-associated heat shock protein Hsp15
MDKWLVYARFVKHRSDAAALIEGGKVRRNGQRVGKVHQSVCENDVLTLVVGNRVRCVKVLGAAERRGPATAARRLYEEIEEQAVEA